MLMDEKEPNQVTPFNEIAVALSGGGFRAASYSLGCLSYLERVIYQGQPLLKRVRFISSASGGSITNLFYSLRMAQNHEASFADIFRQLCDFLDDSSAITAAFEKLKSEEAWHARSGKGRTLINSFAIAYDEKLFGGALFKDLKNSHVSEICINATEFDSGVSFRFQVGTGKMGNSKLSIETSVANEFKLGDILAASSCFPMGFEPIMMPADFAHASLTEETIRSATTHEAEFGLMDGGITDNQGIYSFLLAEKRKFNRDKKGYDLFMYCDVASPYMDGYDLPKEKRSWWGSVSLQTYINLFKFSPVLLGLCAGALWMGVRPWWMISLTTLVTLFTGSYLVCLAAFVSARKKAYKEKSTWMVTLFKYADHLLFTRTSALLQMIQARIKSAGILAGDVYLKQIRRLTIESLYDNEESGDKWRDHAIANMIYELASINPSRSTAFCDGLKDSNGKPIDLTPSPSLIHAADEARSMDTTLWFDEFHVREGRREALIAAGQFTTCYNLIKYLCRLEKGQGLSPELKSLQQTLLKEWEVFCQRPQWLATPHDYASEANRWK
jgi:predicted acylesterase/phospholipase RssA